MNENIDPAELCDQIKLLWQEQTLGVSCSNREALSRGLAFLLQTTRVNHSEAYIILQMYSQQAMNGIIGSGGIR